MRKKTPSEEGSADFEEAASAHAEKANTLGSEAGAVAAEVSLSPDDSSVEASGPEGQEDEEGGRIGGVGVAWSSPSPRPPTSPGEEEDACAVCGDGAEAGAPWARCTVCRVLLHGAPPCLAACKWCMLELCPHCRQPATGHECVLGEAAPEEVKGEVVSGMEPPTDAEEEEENTCMEIAASEVASRTEGFDVDLPALPLGGLVRHARYRTIHAAGEPGSLKVACGVFVFPADRYELGAWPEDAWPLCKRANCFPTPTE